jgi:hypothetical protein
MPHFSNDIKLVWECCKAASVNAGVSCGVIQERHVCRGFCLGPVVLDDGEECVDCVMYLSAWPCAQLIGGQRVMCFGVLCQSVQEKSLEEFGQGTAEIERYDAGSVFSLFPPLYIGCRRESSHALGCISWCHSELKRSCRSLVKMAPSLGVDEKRVYGCGHGGVPDTIRDFRATGIRASCFSFVIWGFLMALKGVA